MTHTLNVPAHAERIEAVKKYIRIHIDEVLDRAVLAHVAGFSVPHFHRVFATQTGMSIAEYVRAVRMERAGRKLRMGAVDITQVALAAGYDSHASFARTFKRHFGLCPSDFRRLSCRDATERLRKGKWG
ncbi:helix-turn-helix domain-containing protein [bacterium]|nr:helix-turn-helix domain-containing protein [bacterium]